MSAAALRSLRAAVAEIAALRDPMSRDAASSATAALEKLEAHLARKRDVGPRLLADVDEDCIKKAELVGGGGVDVRARLGVVEVDVLYCGDESAMSDSKLLDAARAEALDSLRVEIVRRKPSEASDQDLLEALDAAERGGDDEVGEIRVAAHDRGLRCLT